MADTTNPLPSIQEPVVDRFRRWSPVWYRLIKTVLETVRSTNRAVTEVSSTVDGLTATVTEIAESTDGISGRWGVEINVNNRIVGAVRLDGDASTSEFAILADKFYIVHPAADGTTIQAFVVGLVNGVSTVGISGALIVDDSIIARHIDVSTLSAIAANIGTITAGKLQRADGAMVVDLDNKRIVVST